MRTLSLRALAAFAVVLAVVPTLQAEGVFEFTPVLVPNSNIEGFELAPPNTSNLGAFNIVIVPGPGLAGNPAALLAFNRAADQWEARIYDPITVTINANLGPLGAGIIGSASGVFLQAGYNTIRDAVVADGAAAPAAENNGIVNSLPTLAQFSAFVPAGGSVTANITVAKANAKALGFAGLDGIFGVSDATITFSNTFAFDFDDSNGVGAGLLDFETTAAHEIGHVLGFFSAVDQADGGAVAMQATTLDLFRFRLLAANNPSNAAEFTTFPRNLRANSESVFDDLGTEYRMSTGFATGDGRQASHWKDDILLGSHIGIMDPTLSSGLAFPVIDSDFRALDLIGYNVVPEPTSLLLLAIAAVGCLTGLRRRIAK